MKKEIFSIILLITFCYAQIPVSQCETRDLLCCNSVQNINNPTVQTLTGLLGIVVSDTQGLVGLTCSPISVIGIGGNSCSAQPVCCKGNNFNGLIALDCTPVNLNI